MTIESVQCWARDRWEVKTFLLDHGFKQAAKLVDDTPQAIIDQIISAAFSIQRYRDTARNQKRPVLCAKIRTEQDMDRAEFARAIMAFQSQDMLARNKDWRERLGVYVKSQIDEAQYLFLQKIKAPFPHWIEQEFARRNPKPQPTKIEAHDIAAIEDARPGREDYNRNLVELLERFCSHLCNVKLSWEELTSELGTRDPRAKKAEYKRKKEAVKEAASEQAA